jgi:hypothetical protein
MAGGKLMTLESAQVRARVSLGEWHNLRKKNVNYATHQPLRARV